MRTRIVTAIWCTALVAVSAIAAAQGDPAPDGVDANNTGSTPADNTTTPPKSHVVYAATASLTEACISADNTTNDTSAMCMTPDAIEAPEGTTHVRLNLTNDASEAITVNVTMAQGMMDDDMMNDDMMDEYMDDHMSAGMTMFPITIEPGATEELRFKADATNGNGIMMVSAEGNETEIGRVTVASGTVVGPGPTNETEEEAQGNEKTPGLGLALVASVIGITAFVYRRRKA